MLLYHATSTEKMMSVMTQGLLAGSCLTDSPEQADYYAETIRDEGMEAVIVELDLDDLVAAVGEENIAPDHASISEPITSTIERSEDEVHEAWEAAEGTWRESLDIVSSIRITVPVPAHILRCEEFNLAVGGPYPIA